ncbi:bifunctional diaminohydroxyphosphoribosylaminopyrimidine deaminase/5-amino-6-(5-phosphoribosylamino)uracil reductase RibD [Brachybacterium aquaticum]|uniref:Riboflavin biosynthesis protein RibD n=1 Tax=Brachybacterium aquaticum TaxID=1432564 RepID=A0A841ADQ3_9MICO|nr:bifunctional diaminohydroxyphosphoribosylaminopyrimidine deaminase/5-amino-6-(5-phosphoribosylamino)uracil reductase RibD [Brachybacterium aquaticum]MBB5832966.1 diaminohydroxyphosphoribosylaminopyrimidine deaminase/5-amino-6-(5-phosphoribosylamino)uracil reductase [Brachybacterium aquaticum]
MSRADTEATTPCTTMSCTTEAERAALHHALDLAAAPGVPAGPNPRVGCVLLAPDGRILGEGRHRGAGTAHAEVDALRSATGPVRGATALVTLEPCDHHGRTGPCTQALRDAGIARVVVARRDPNPVAAGGLDTLREAGIDVAVSEDPQLTARAEELLRGWEHGLVHHRPLVTAKLALTLDGRAAAADGTSRWITGPAARAEVHDLRECCDAVLVGTGTARLDAPQLTARHEDGTLRARQPLRVVMGEGEAPALPTLPGAGEALRLRTRDPEAALEDLFDRGIRHVLVEGGPTLAAAFLTAGLVDELIVHLAPSLLGAGPAGIGDLGITTITDRLDLELRDLRPLPTPDGPTDLRLLLQPRTR